MKYPCDLIRDLIPLYVDSVCSDVSAEIVKEHLGECEECRKYYEEISELVIEAVSVKQQEFEKQQADSLKKMKRKWNKKKKLFVVLGAAIGGAVMYIFIRFILPLLLALGFLVGSSVLAKPKVITDAKEYTTYIGMNSDREYGTLRQDQFRIFPEKIGGEVLDFQYVYYNPFDPQYVAYLTVNYDEEEYQRELSRLKKIKFEKYVGYYSVTDEPADYDLVAMDSDYYHGFCYAMVPGNDNHTITYVGIVFCNYFLDLDIHKYMPDKYLLQGFDATKDNPYEQKMMHK